MAMRVIMVFVLLTALTGCLKKSGDEAMVTEPVATEETSNVTVLDASQRASEPSVDSQAVSSEKPSAQNIQQALKNANLYEGKIDGIIGPNTRSAIEAFQSQNGLKVDGKVGPMTWEKLKEYLNQQAE
ncbi:MAG: peptidoglycan-binding domain-containing protein [Candidatus Omnitrophota bacterium]|nr:peptidoglycan-binding domain-containing protein [Candidatus Omnitrophota bacterium]